MLPLVGLHLSLILLVLHICVWQRIFSQLAEPIEGKRECPETLANYLEEDTPSECLCPRLDHAAPGLRSEQPPEAICYLAKISGLSKSYLFYPYPGRKGLWQQCN